MCNKCGIKKPVEEFNFNKTKGRIEYHCKKCHSEYLKNHYEENKQYYKDKASKRTKELREWLREIKSKLCCAKCDQNHPAALDFHHDDPKLKEMTVASAVNNGWNKERILEEIEKCTVLCATCHRIHHWQEKYGL